MTTTGQISTEVARILAAADADIAARKPVCVSSGRCCHFEAWGHRLYVTGVELLHFAQAHGPQTRSHGHAIENRTSKTENQKSISLPLFFAQAQIEGCPYQAGKLCTARKARPLGCRVYFCDENAKAWQEEVYEKYHAMLQQLHRDSGIPYAYTEWREALRQLA